MEDAKIYVQSLSMNKLSCEEKIEKLLYEWYVLWIDIIHAIHPFILPFPPPYTKLYSTSNHAL
jgi:hypothetical protein